MSDIESQFSWFIDSSSNFWGLLQHDIVLVGQFLEKLVKGETLNSLQPWLQTLATPITLIVIARNIQTIFETSKLKEDRRAEEEQKQRQREESRQEALRQYFQQMTELLTTHQLADAKHNEPVFFAAQALTITIIRSLDREGIGQVSSFLVHSKLASKEKGNPSILANADLSFVNFRKAEIKSINFSGTILIGADLRNADLRNANLTDANLTGADLTGANLTDADLTGARLSDTKLTNTNLTNTNLTGAKLTDAQLYGADLTDAKLNRAILYGANLNRAILNAANLSGANFTGALLYGADLNGANLTGTKLYGADLTSANLTGADLTSAQLYGALELEVKQVKTAQNWEQAKYSEQFRKQLDLSPQNSSFLLPRKKVQ